MTHYCQLAEHFGKEVPATHKVAATGADCTTNADEVYVCTDHVPTVAETIDHNERQGTVLETLRVWRLDTFELVTDYTREI